ncbi:hypothetical protein [Corallococcus exiguus]|uniref:hypothetical protein n=1 Tax=Corallococcus exiguus TaxID=83462 RepID=UPI0020B6C31A|nr:hypothetical protein [Corallococcus exiguus]
MSRQPGRRELTVEVFVHERCGGVAERQPAGAEWRVWWLRGTADLNRQGSGTATVRVTAPGCTACEVSRVPGVPGMPTSR